VTPVRSYETWCVLFPEHDGFRQTVNARSPGRAKYERHLSISDAWPGVPFTSMRARVVGPPRSNDHFLHVARLRGRPDVRCGDRVRLGPPDGRAGVIVGHTGGANWDVLFDDGSSGAVHPDECTYGAEP
jgi:hypothetical protein